MRFYGIPETRRRVSFMSLRARVVIVAVNYPGRLLAFKENARDNRVQQDLYVSTSAGSSAPAKTSVAAPTSTAATSGRRSRLNSGRRCGSNSSRRSRPNSSRRSRPNSSRRFRRYKRG
ncbi:hypothetical protein LSAT2_025930 [Lamellibrachia satsuma]|nr:hypothetical protein LSAT2_025930 [Lamellibrachia satsuma]